MNKPEQSSKSWFNVQKYFFAGFIAILPLWITFSILKIIFKWISNATKPVLEPIIEISLGKEPAAFLVTLTSFIFTLFIVYISGILVTNLVSKKILLKIEDLLTKIPFLKDIYSASRELMRFAFGEKRQYRRVVLIEWPSKGYYCIGFVTSEIQANDKQNPQKMVSVFIPTTPNPTTGYLTILPEIKTIPTEIGADDALKIIISGGLLGSNKLQNLSLIREK